MFRMLLSSAFLIAALMSSVLAAPPFPAGMTIQNPAGVSDPQRANLLGVWTGDFGIGGSTGLAVTNVNADGTLTVIYAVEENDPSLSHAKPPMRAVLQGNTLHLPPFLGSGAVVTFEFRRNGTLRGTYAREGFRRARGTFRKAN